MDSCSQSTPLGTPGRAISVGRSNGGEVYIFLDATYTLAINDSKLDIALVTPRGSPRVLNQPVVLVILSTVAHSQNSVVEIRTAPDIIKDA